MPRQPLPRQLLAVLEMNEERGQRACRKSLQLGIGPVFGSVSNSSIVFSWSLTVAFEYSASHASPEGAFWSGVAALAIEMPRATGGCND